MESQIRLNEKGQCPYCKKKPLFYKKPTTHYFCARCDRSYSVETKEMIENWAWTLDNKKKKPI